MRRTAILCVCFLALSATESKAWMYFSYTRTSYDASLDKIEFHITGLTGAQAGEKINGLSGTWTAYGGTINLSTSSVSWKWLTQLDNSFNQPAPPLSFVNLNVNAGDLTRVGSGSAYTSFSGTWFTTEPASWLQPVDPDLGDGIDQTLLATMYVTKGGGVNFVGQVSQAISGTVYDISSSPLSPPPEEPPPDDPEPSTLALLSVGAVGFLLHTWRKRRKSGVAG